MKIYSCFDKEFAPYGCVIEGYDVQQLLDVLANRPCPDDVLYVPSDAELEALPVAKEIQDTLCGMMPMQIGFTNGHCHKMNALEYHKSSEFNVSDEDIILLLAKRQELSDDYHMNTDKVKAFLVPKGVLVEVYATTLHYAPCQANENGYRCIVVLPKGTNMPLNRTGNRGGEDVLMTATNKWLVGHPDGGCDEGTWLGLEGENLTV